MVAVDRVVWWAVVLAVTWAAEVREVAVTWAAEAREVAGGMAGGRRALNVALVVACWAVPCNDPQLLFRHYVHRRMPSRRSTFAHPGTMPTLSMLQSTCCLVCI